MMKKIGIGCGGLVGLFVVLAIVGAIVGGSSTKHSSGTAASVTQVTTHHARKRHKAKAASKAKAKPTPRFTRYAGLGATIADFKHDNTMFCLNCALQPGEAAYNIKGQRDGLVTAYQVAEDFKPAASAATRLSLVAGTMIPGPIKDGEPIRETADCEDFRVPELKKLIGVEYAEASTTPYSTMAFMQAVKTPTC